MIIVWENNFNNDKNKTLQFLKEVIIEKAQDFDVERSSIIV